MVNAAAGGFTLNQITITCGGNKKECREIIAYDTHMEWDNPYYETLSSLCKYDVDVIFRTEVFGSFEAKIVFDFNRMPMIFRELRVEPALEFGDDDNVIALILAFN